MWDDKLFDAEKIQILNIKLIGSKIESDDNFDINSITAYKTDHTLEIGFNPENKFSRVEFKIKMETQSSNDEEARSEFEFITVFLIDNFEELTEIKGNEQINVHPLLINSLISITYSTIRGLLISKLQGTAFNSFILPVINPNKLLFKA